VTSEVAQVIDLPSDHEEEEDNNQNHENTKKAMSIVSESHASTSRDSRQRSPVIEEADGVVMGHALLTQEPYSGALALIEHGHEKIGAGRLTV
jgi:hypothetical protein